MTLIAVLGGLTLVFVVGNWLLDRLWPLDDRPEDQPDWLGNEKR